MKKMSILAASIALLVSGCGSDEDNAASQFSVRAIDGYLQNAEIYVGKDCALKVGETDIDGVVKIDITHQGKNLCVKAIKGKTLDSQRGTISKDFTLRAVDGNVISPITDLVAAKIAANSDLTKEEAKQEVSESFVGITSDTSILYGDYIAQTATNKEAKAINIIGETLVDNVVSDDTLNDLINDIAAKVDKDESLDDYSPVIEGGQVQSNHRPYVKMSKEEQDRLENLTVELGTPTEPIDLSLAFADKDGDTMTLSVVEEDGKFTLKELGLAFDAVTKRLTGTPLKAGEIELHAYATDSRGARSYPLEIEIDVTTPNQAPVVDPAKVKEIESELANINLTVSTAVDQTIELDGLFTDADEDKFTLTVTEDLSGVSVSVIDGDDLHLEGTPDKGGDYTITINADDGKHQAVSATLKGSVASNGFIHPLEGKLWYTTEWGTIDNKDKGNLRVWCDTYKYENNTVFMNQRTEPNLTSCTNEATVKVASYTINNDGEMVMTFSGENGEESEIVKVKDAIGGIGDGAKTVVFDGRYTFFPVVEDVEKRINMLSNNDLDKRNFYAEFPAAEDEIYQKSTLSAQMMKTDSMVDFQLHFDGEKGDLTCSEVKEFYNLFLYSGSSEIGISPNRFFEIEEGEDKKKYCAVQFLITNPQDGNIYSVIADHAKGSNRGLVEKIKLNMKWTGTGNNQ